VWNLKLTIGNLVMSMIEENTAESLLVAKVTIMISQSSISIIIVFVY